MNSGDKTPEVSIIMPCFNHGGFLGDSVESILRQTHAGWELILVDDCSTDNSWAVMEEASRRDARIQTIRHARNQGLSRARNDGLRTARGEFIAFCDADDLWEPEKLKVQLALLSEQPEFDAVYSDAWIIDGAGLRTGQRFSDLYPPPKPSSGRLFRQLVPRNFINIQTVLLRRACVESLGSFDEQIEQIQDWWYWIRLAREHRFLYCPTPLARYRVHARSTNVLRQREYRVNRFKVYRRMLSEYPDLALSVKAEVLFNMGAELCDLGKWHAGRRLLWRSVVSASSEPRAMSICCRALRRLVLAATGHNALR